MSLPPVVSDPEVCPVRNLPTTVDCFRPPHDYHYEALDTSHSLIEVCRYCGGRKP